VVVILMLVRTWVRRGKAADETKRAAAADPERDGELRKYEDQLDDELDKEE